MTRERTRLRCRVSRKWGRHRTDRVQQIASRHLQALLFEKHSRWQGSSPPTCPTRLCSQASSWKLWLERGRKAIC